MGEIKSTLDLVMEKTKHLTLSREEKEEQNRIEVDKRLKGLLQKYQDNKIMKVQLEKEVKTLEKSFALNVNDMLLNLLLSYLQLDRTYKWQLELLSEIFGLDVSGLETIFQDFKKAVKSVTENRVNEIKAQLAEKRQISGSAVVPNLGNDGKWLSMLGDVKGRFDQILSSEKSALTAKPS